MYFLTVPSRNRESVHVLALDLLWLFEEARYHQINYSLFNQPCAVSEYKKSVYLHMNGLIFETSGHQIFSRSYSPLNLYSNS